MPRWFYLFALTLCCSVVLRPAWGAPKPAVKLSPYERQTRDLVLAERGLAIDPSPDGKKIVGLEVAVLDVIEDRDPAPNFLNWLHVNSRDDVIRRELLIAPGAVYQQDLVSESERNLRGLRQLSLVVIVPVRTGDPETVRLLVIAKDVWSLRLNSAYRFKAGQLEYLYLQPAEENIFGTHRRALGIFVYEPDTLSFGARVVDPRIAGSRYMMALDGNVILNQDSGEAEGTFGFFQYGKPLYSSRQRWSWGSTVGWLQEVTRRHVGVEVATYDAPETEEVEEIPYVYNSDVLSGRVSLTRSFGTDLKQSLRLGMEAERGVYRAPGLQEYSLAAAESFTDTVMPVSDTRIGPFLQYHFYFNRYISALNIDTLGLQENFRKGLEMYARLQPFPRFLRSTRDLIRYQMSGAYTQAMGDGLVRAYLAGNIDASPAGDHLYDAELQTGFRAVSPRFKIGRLVYDSTLSYRFENYLNKRVTLGGDGRLRGYPSGFFVGKDLFAANLEFRSRPLQLWTIQLAGLAFYDVGDAFNGWSSFRPKQGAGLGMRVLFPQLGRIVMRMDWGFALTPIDVPLSPLEGLVISFRQAFGTPFLTGQGVSLMPL